MASNQKRIVKRLIEAGNRHYNWAIWEATSNGRVMVAVLEGGTFQDAVKLMNAPRTASGNTYLGFKKVKAS